MKEFTFFLIDDDEDDRELFALALEDTDLNFKYHSAASCCDALIMLKNDTFKPDFIFLDLNMPQMSGRECLLELKKTLATSHIPITIFSTSNDPGDKKDTAEMGAVDFITKPSKTSELTVILTSFISRQLTETT